MKQMTPRQVLLTRVSSRLASDVLRVAEDVGWEKTGMPEKYETMEIWDRCCGIADRHSRKKAMDSWLENLSRPALEQFAKEVRLQATGVVLSIRRHRERLQQEQAAAGGKTEPVREIGETRIPGVG